MTLHTNTKAYEDVDADEIHIISQTFQARGNISKISHLPTSESMQIGTIVSRMDTMSIQAIADQRARTWFGNTTTKQHVRTLWKDPLNIETESNLRPSRCNLIKKMGFLGDINRRATPHIDSLERYSAIN